MDLSIIQKHECKYEHIVFTDTAVHYTLPLYLKNVACEYVLIIIESTCRLSSCKKYNPFKKMERYFMMFL